MNGSATIVAPATAPTRGAVGILRISGPLALELGRRAAPGIPPEPTPRHAYFTRFVDGSGRPLDEGIFLYFRAPNSFTGEDVVELQTHGSPKLLQVLQREILAGGAGRPAEPGEFSRRAFVNGRIDLTRAEAIADLVAAESEAAVRAAAARLAGEWAERTGAVRRQVLEVLAEIEGVLEFPEDAELERDVAAEVRALRAATEGLVEAARGAERSRASARVVLCGPVNAGKSTLFNRLLGEERALVDPEPGTTRDLVEARVEWDGLGLTLIDTAGMREGAGRLEELGIARARGAAAEADLVVLVLPPDASDEAAGELRAMAGERPVLLVDAQSDRGAHRRTTRALATSGLTGEGVAALKAAILDRLWAADAPASAVRVGARESDALRRAGEALHRAERASGASTLEVVAGELTAAAGALDELTGGLADADLLDALFQRFCIGK